jgi:hypothetical protein
VPHICTSMFRNCLLSYIVAVVCLIHVLLSETDNHAGVENVFDKSLWTVNDSFFNDFHNMILLTVD